MEVAALITWVITALGGFVLLARGSAGVGCGREPVADSAALAWVSFAILVVVALLGFTMAARWLQDRRASWAAGGPPSARPPEQHFPVAVVVLHGLLAATTLVLVLLAALGAGS
jgi:hypothetical protein